MKLALPPLDERADPAVETRRVFVEEWIEALPYANPRALVEAVAGALAKLNRTPLKPGHRLELLELHLHPYEYLAERGPARAPVDTLAALERQRAEAGAARRVAMELATGYERALVDAAGRRRRFRGDRDLRLATQRATLLLADALLHSYDEYLPTPPRLWRELTALYRFAARAGFADEPVADRSGRAERRASVADTYKRAVLAGLVDPHRLDYGEIWDVAAALAACGDRAVLGEGGVPERSAGHFVILPEADQRPRGYAEVRPDPGSEYLLLDAGPVLEVLRRWQAGDTAGAPERRPRPGLLAIMIRALDLPPRRHTPRRSGGGVVRLAIGLRAVHAALGGEAPGAGAPRPGPAPPAIEGLEAIEPEPEPGAGPAEAAAPPARPRPEPEDWELVDRGPGGVGVLRRSRPGRSLAVGELVGILDPGTGPGTDEPGAWSIGVVRWLTIEADAYHAGLQFLGRGAEPVALEGGGPDEPAPAVAVPGLERARGAALLAAPGTFAARNGPLLARAPTRLARVEAEAVVEATARFERVSFRILDEAPGG